MTTRRWTSPALAVLAMLCATAAPGGAQDEAPTPVERAVRQFVRALAMHDLQAFTAATLPHPRGARLLNREPLTPDQRSDAERRLESLQVRVGEEFSLRGRPVEREASGDYPVGTVGQAIAAGQGGPTPLTLVRHEDGWKVDLRWLIAMIDLSEATGPPAEGTPDYAIKRLLLALLALDLVAVAVPGAGLDVFFAGAPQQREPSGVLEGAAMEMPLVEVGPGEFYRLPSGRVVEGTSVSDSKVMVGQFGPVEMPFVLRRVGGAWRVEAEPYYMLINR